MRPIAEAQIGARYGRLTVTGDAVPSGPIVVPVRCDCGAEQTIALAAIGRTMLSCGCLTREAEGDGTRRRGQSQHPTYSAWSSIKARCFDPDNPAYPHYGGRGITMCDEWQESFLAFIDYIGTRPSPGHSLDRIDVNGNYEPGNVRWATRQVQATNTRRSLRDTCANGHLRTSENIGVTKTGHRYCRRCNLDNQYRMWSRQAAQAALPPGDGVPLAPRELETLRLSAQGLLHREIAEAFGVRRTTVATYAHHARVRLGASTTTEAIRIARERGYIPSAPSQLDTLDDTLSA